MDNGSYYIDQQLQEYKAAIAGAYKQFHLDEESRVAAAHALVNSTVMEYRTETDAAARDALRRTIVGMLSMAAACHLMSFEEIGKFKKLAGITTIEVPFKMRF